MRIMATSDLYGNLDGLDPQSTVSASPVRRGCQPSPVRGRSNEPIWLEM